MPPRPYGNIGIGESFLPSPGVPVLYSISSFRSQPRSLSRSVYTRLPLFSPPLPLLFYNLPLSALILNLYPPPFSTAYFPLPFDFLPPREDQLQPHPSPLLDLTRTAITTLQPSNLTSLFASHTTHTRHVCELCLETNIDRLTWVRGVSVLQTFRLSLYTLLSTP